MINLTITEEEFNKLYPDLEGYYSWFDTPVTAGVTKDRFEQVYLKSKLWRLNNIYKVINKQGDVVTFRMNLAQHRVYAASRKHPRVIILKSRQQGISTFWLVSYFDDSLWRSYLNVGLMAQGANEASTLLERTKFLWDNLNADIKAFARIALQKDNTKEYSFSNNSSMFIRTSFRSATLQRLHVSEFGKIANSYPKRAREVKTGTLQTLAPGNTGVIESTAEGNNDFKTMWDASVLALNSGEMSPKDFYPIFLSWLDDPDCRLSIDQSEDNEASEYFNKLEELTGRTVTKEQRNFWIAQRRELGGDITQEYPGTPEEAFMASKDGTYWSRQFNETCVRAGQIKKGLYDKNLPVTVYFDLGVNDYMVLLFVQTHRGERRIVHEYFNDGYGLSHYLDYVKFWEYGDNVKTLKFPHDIEVREQGNSHKNGRAKKRREVVQEYKRDNYQTWSIQTLAKGGLLDGIELVRAIIPNLYIDPSCTYIISCLNSYTKEWDELLKTWKKTPRHDVYSHGADALRQMASDKSVSNSKTDKPRSNTSIPQGGDV